MSLGSGGAVARGEEDGAMVETEGGSKEVAVKTKVRKTLCLWFYRIVNTKIGLLYCRRCESASNIWDGTWYDQCFPLILDAVLNSFS
jgi:hypothetical protein